MVTPRPDKGRNDRHHPDVTVTGHIWKPMWQKGIRWNVKGSAVTVTLHNSSL